ncbi:hypothetical protein [Novibacillus thermophilus]|uniref:hypothetical protein n=1 Tax=Novibacillus thermophilus TaxID=1471761 RepID=UPI0011EA55B1|nr:hypothetical protein [Novibacillus thermophilus]
MGRQLKGKLKRWSKIGCIYAVVIVLTVVATHFYHERETMRYIQAYKDAGGDEVLSDISDTYKLIVENYSNYKLGTDTKRKIVRTLDQLQDQLEEVDRQINQNKSIQHKIDFSFIYHDMKLVRLSLSDTTKDDIVPVIVLHANEGLKELEKEITYIEYR